MCLKAPQGGALSFPLWALLSLSAPCGLRLNAMALDPEKAWNRCVQGLVRPVLSVIPHGQAGWVIHGQGG